MKQHRLIRLLCAAAILVIALCTLAACGDDTDVVINSPDTAATTTTAPVPLGPMTLENLTREMAPDMTWSAIKMYDHTVVDSNHARFEVRDDNDNVCTLDVTFDEAADTVSQADLTYGELTVSVLTDSTAPIRDIMVAIRQANEA